jgi:hypothetical protein
LLGVGTPALLQATPQLPAGPTLHQWVAWMHRHIVDVPVSNDTAPVHAGRCALTSVAQSEAQYLHARKKKQKKSKKKPPTHSRHRVSTVPPRTLKACRAREDVSSATIRHCQRHMR